MMQVISTIGAALILGGYFGLQRDFFTREDRWFNVLNFVGSALLAWVAIVDRRIGFILLETVWALLSVPGMIRAGKKTIA